MIDLVKEFVVFLLEFSLAYLAIRAVILYFSIKALKAELEEHIESRMVPVTVEFDNNQYYCYNKENKEFMAQGASGEEIKKRLEDRFHDCVIYIDGGDPAVIERLLK